jgi:hypothetical protein
MANDILTSLSTISESDLEGATPPSEKVVDWFHSKASSNRPEDIHHATGTGNEDAAGARHRHTGKDSLKILDPGMATLGNLPSNATTAQMVTAINNINAALRLLGAG